MEKRMKNRMQKWQATAILTISLAAAGAAGQQRSAPDPDVQLKAAAQIELLDGDLKRAIAAYQKIAGGPDRTAAAKAWLEIGRLYEREASAEARNAYERVVREFGNQTETVAQAQARLKALGATTPSAAIAHKSRTLISNNSRLGTPLVPRFQSVSPDGRYIYLSHGIVFDQVTSQQKDIDAATDRIWDAAFSADSRQIAYEVNRDEDAEDGPFEIRANSLDAAGSGPGKVLFRNEEFIGGRPFGWSRDGKTIFAVLTRKDRTYEIAAISAANGSFRTIKSLEWRWPAGMSLSPDGRYIAYDASVAKESMDRDIFLLSTDGAIEVALAQNSARDAVPFWTPDGNAVVFTSDREGTPGLWMMEVTDGKPRGVAVNLRKKELLRPLGFSADGTLYYTSDKAPELPGYYIADVDLAERTPSRPEVQIGSGALTPSASYSPDGKRLAYSSYTARVSGPYPYSPNSGGLIVIRSLDSGEEKQIPVGSVVDLAWMPDGQSIVFVGTMDSDPSISALHRIDLNTGKDLMGKDLMGKVLESRGKVAVARVLCLAIPFHMRPVHTVLVLN